MNKNQRGIAHIGIIAAVILVVSLLAFTVYNSAQTRNEVDPNSSETNLQDDIDKNQVESVDKVDEIEVEKEESQKDDNETSQDSSETIPEKKFVEFTKGGNEVDSDSVRVSATSSSTLPLGTCTYTFTLGNSKVVVSNSSNGNTCEKDIPMSEFPKNGFWYFTLSYVSKDGLTTGSGGEYKIDTTPVAREISFSKGGVGQSGDEINVNMKLSENHNGTCTYRFSLNGTTRVEKSNQISNQYCSISIDQSEFPKSAKYDFKLIFDSTDGSVVAYDYHDVEVN